MTEESNTAPRPGESDEEFRLRMFESHPDDVDNAPWFSPLEVSNLVSSRLDEIDVTISDFKEELPNLLITSLEDMNTKKRKIRNQNIKNMLGVSGRYSLAGSIITIVLRFIEFLFF